MLLNLMFLNLRSRRGSRTGKDGFVVWKSGSNGRLKFDAHFAASLKASILLSTEGLCRGWLRQSAIFGDRFSRKKDRLISGWGAKLMSPG